MSEVTMSETYFRRGSYEKVELGEGNLSRRLLAYGGGLMLTEMEFEAGSRSVAHAHAEEQLTYCLSGEFECLVGGVKGSLHPGDSFYAGPGVEHGVLCLADGRLLHMFTPQREEYK
jgi:quercetin dioxygenase-like cupin family protein